jgi:ankyrin repeat protein
VTAKPLPENPSFENLRKQAKGLQKAVRAGDPKATAQAGALHPRGDAVRAAFSLADAQLVMARGYGFASWARLKRHLEAVQPFAFDPWAPAPPAPGPVDRFLRLACLTYGAWSPADAVQARGLLDEQPGLAEADIYAAAAAGHVSAARALLAREPALARTKGGPFGWEPLLYACYSRLDAPTLEVARLLLAAGADPNAGFLWRGMVPPFTGLTGAFGEGEDGPNQPPHPQRDALARLLLEAGADPNDEQTLYNLHFGPDDGHLKLLLAYGLGQDRGGPWLRRLAERMITPGQMLVEELWSAARKGYLERVKLLVAHGADVNAAGRRDGHTPYQSALLADQREIAAYLAEHGARPSSLTPLEAFGVACVAGRGDEARTLLAADPELLARLGPGGRARLLHRAVEAGRPEGIRLMAELGFDPGATTHHDNMGVNKSVTPMHNAAGMGSLEMVTLLVELGADPNVREPHYHATPLGWAAHGGHREVVEYLMPMASIFDAVQHGGLERAAELLARDASLANARDENGRPLLFYLHAGLARAPEMVALLRAHGADPQARDREGRTVLDEMARRGSEGLAHLLRGQMP